MKHLLTGIALAFAAAAPAWAGPTLDAVKSNGAVTCGLSTGLAGFAAFDKAAKPAGLDADICRAVSAAAFGTPDKVKFVALAPEQRLTALQTGQVDLEVLDASLVADRARELGLTLAPTVFYDGAGFLVPKSLGVSSARQLSGAAVCLLKSSPDAQHLADYFHGNKLDLRAVPMNSAPEIEQSFFFGRCDAYMTDVLALADMRIAKATNPSDYAILPERISKSQYAPALRSGDKDFYNLVRWTVFTLIEAEERGVTSRNAGDLQKTDDPGIRRLLASEPDIEKALPADDKRAVSVIRAVGNYGEVFARSIGEQSQLRLARGQNALYLTTIGGLMLSPQAQ
jgi:general L-amino acid transport system substrate-binding protein